MPYRQDAASSEASPERLVREVIQYCDVCDYCRDLLDDKPCLFLPELFRLADAQRSRGEQAKSNELRDLVALCTMCGLCSCSKLRADVRQAKDAFVAREGLTPTARVLGNVQRIGKLGAAHPRLANALLANGPAAALLKAAAGIHPERLQFHQLLPYEACHPVEILRESYQAYRREQSTPAVHDRGAQAART